MNFSKDQIEFSRVNPVQWKELQQLSISTFSQAFEADNNPTDFAIYLKSAFAEEQIRSELQSPKSEFYFVLLLSKIVGYLKLNLPDPKAKSDMARLEIERIYLLKTHQGKSYGEKMIRFSENLAQNINADVLFLGVWEKNVRAIRFYQRCGFTIYGNHTFTLGTEIQNDILLQKNISPKHN